MYPIDVLKVSLQPSSASSPHVLTNDGIDSYASREPYTRSRLHWSFERNCNDIAGRRNQRIVEGLV